MKNSSPTLGKIKTLLLTAAFPLFFLARHAGAAEEPAMALTDRQGRSLEVIVLAVHDDKIRVRRVSDGREFVLPAGNLSDESKEKLRALKHLDPTEAVAKPPEESTHTGEALLLPPAGNLSDASKEKLVALKHPEPPQGAAKPAGGIDLPDEVLAYMRGEWQAAKGQIADPVQRRAVFHCWQFSMLIALENDLVAAATPKDPASPIDWPDWVSPQVRREAETLQQRIRDAERRRIFTAAGVLPHNSESSQSDHIDKLRLADLYDETVKVHRERRYAAQDRLLQEGKRPGQVKPEQTLALGNVEETLRAANESISALHQAFYGFSLGEWLRPAPAWPADHPAEILRKEISTLREAVYHRLMAPGNYFSYRAAHDDDGRYYYSLNPDPYNPGVILQLSPKMSSHILSLQKQYERVLDSTKIREVVGCQLSLGHELTLHTKHGVPANTLELFEELIMLEHVDTIYWFCDLEKTYSMPGLVRLRDLLRMSNTRLYLKSIGEKPDKEMQKLISRF